MNRHRLFSLVCLSLGVLSLAGCSGARETLGLGRKAPDEYTVVARAPLSLPPDFALRPPQPGAPRPQDVEIPQRAATVVLGKAESASMRAGGPSRGGSRGSGGEQALLSRAGAEAVSPEIRAQVNKEAQAQRIADRSWVDSLLFWQDRRGSGTVVDPKAEARRLQENADSGRPLTEGQTPTIERRRRAPLEGLFD